MTGERVADRASSAKKAALLAAMRAAPALTEARPTAEPVPKHDYDTSFASLPGYADMRTQRGLADALGITVPFYRNHDMRAGAESRIDGRDVLNFASYDYLGLNAHPEITAAVVEAAQTWGTSVSASRITAGERAFHGDFERALASVYDAEDCLVFVSGHAAAVSTIAALLGPKDLILHDAFIHNCIVVGAQLSGAARRIFPHNDLDALESLLASQRDSFERVLIVSEGLFSMDGDGPDLARLVEIKERWGAWLMMDDAHALGILGATGRGIFEMAGVDPGRVDIWFGTLSKTLVSCGGYVAGNRTLVEYLKFAAPGMVYSVGIPGPAAVASMTALAIMRREPERVTRLQANGRLFIETAAAAGLDVGSSWGYAVTPVIVRDSLKTVLLAARLLNRGVNVFPIIPPGVPERSARLRFFISSSHTAEQIHRVVAMTREELDGLDAEGVTVATASRLLRR